MQARYRLALVLLATISSAAEAANLVPNPDFDSGLTGWTLYAGSAGTFTLDSSNGSPAPPSIHLVASHDSAPYSIAVGSECMSIDASRHVDLTFQLVGYAGLGYASILAYSDTDCATTPTTLGTPAYRVGGVEWGAVSLLDQTLPTGTHSAKVLLGVTMGSFGAQGDAHFDHIAFGPVGTTPVSLQAFEVD